MFIYKGIAGTRLNESDSFVPAASIQDLYKAYSNSGDINNKLREAKLFTSLSKLYTYPITLLHEMIKSRYPGEEDNFLYAVYLYKNVSDNVHPNSL